MNFVENIILEFTALKPIDKSLNNDIDLIKIIKLNDYKDNKLIKINEDECSICLEQFVYCETNINDITKLLYETINYKKTNIGDFVVNSYNKIDDYNNICIISCYHIFHKKCLLKWCEK